MTTVEYVIEILGGERAVGSRSVRRLQDFLTLTRRGLPYRAFTSLARSIELDEDATREAVGISKRTLERRKTSQRLEPDESERLVNLARVLAAARDVFADDAKAKQWLVSVSRALSERPITLVSTSIGFELVMDELKRIEHGIVG